MCRLPWSKHGQQCWSFCLLWTFNLSISFEACADAPTMADSAGRWGGCLVRCFALTETPDTQGKCFRGSLVRSSRPSYIFVFFTSRVSNVMPAIWTVNVRERLGWFVSHSRQRSHKPPHASTLANHCVSTIWFATIHASAKWWQQLSWKSKVIVLTHWPDRLSDDSIFPCAIGCLYDLCLGLDDDAPLLPAKTASTLT